MANNILPLTPTDIDKMAREAGLPYIGWRPVKREGDWVLYRSGAGEPSWQHLHEDGDEHPGDYSVASLETKCRDCGKAKP